MIKKERLILTCLCYGHFMSHFNMLIFPAVVLPLTAGLNMDMSAVLSLSFWMYMLFGITALPWGIAADRWKASPLLTIYFIGAGISGLCAAFWIDSALWLSVSLAGIGLFSGVYHPIGTGVISKHISDVSVGMGINGMFGNLGLALAPLTAGAILWLNDAQTVYIVVGIMNLLGLVFMFFYPRSAKVSIKKDKPYVNAEKKEKIMPSFILMLISVMITGIIYRGSTVIAPAYFELKIKTVFEWLILVFGGNISENLTATSIVSLIYLIGIPGQYFGGRAVKNFDLKKSYLCFNLIIFPMTFLLGTAANVNLIILAAVYFFFLMGIQPVQNTLMGKLSPKRFLHSAYGAQFTLVFGVGSLAVMMVGFVEKSAGINAVFPFLGIFSVLACIVTLILLKFGVKQTIKHGESD